MYPLDTLALKMLNVIREELRDEIERREEKAVRDAQIAAKAERRQKRLDEKAKEMAKVGVRIDEEDVADELDKEEVRIVKTYYHEIVSHCLSVVVALTFTAAVVLWWLLGFELGWPAFTLIESFTQPDVNVTLIPDFTDCMGRK